jgi:hypothetical protein
VGLILEIKNLYPKIGSNLLFENQLKTLKFLQNDF